MVPSPTGAQTIPFGLVFKEPVEGLGAEDFEVGGSSGGWSVTGVTAPLPATRSRSARTIRTRPTARSSSPCSPIRSPTSRTTPAHPTPRPRRPTYAEDDDPPTVLLYQSPHKTTITNGKLDYVDVTATFSEPVTGFEPNDVTIGGTSHAADPWQIETIFGDGASYGFSLLNGNWRDGTLTFQIGAGAVHDLAGNPVQASNIVTMVFDR